MKNILIINGHEYYPFSEGKLTETLIQKATVLLEEKNYEVKTSSVKAWNVDEEIGKHQWADAIILQFPSNWMMIPWSLKKYFDEVFTAGMMGILCDGDGRTSKTPKTNYGTGGVQKGKKYMLSATFNAPEEAFNNPEEYLFQGKSVDDLFFPIHMNYRFFGMEQLPTFACYDVMKNPTIEEDFIRLETHSKAVF